MSNSTVAFNDSKDLAIVGDFANYFKYGIAKEILMDVIPYGDPDNTGLDLKGNNQIFYPVRSLFRLGQSWTRIAFARILKTEG